MAILLVIAVEYWRAHKSSVQQQSTKTYEVRGLLPVANANAPQSIPTIQPAAGPPNSSLEADLIAAAEALGDANQRVEQLGRERNALLAERNELNRERAELLNRIEQGSQEREEQFQEVSRLQQQLLADTNEGSTLRSKVGEMQAQIEALSQERNNLRTRLAAIQQRAQSQSQAQNQQQPAPLVVRRATETSTGTQSRSVPTSQTASQTQTDAPRESTENGIEAYNAGDYQTAERIWTDLAERGSPRAQFHLGSLLFEGRAGEPDLVQAYIWLSRAVDRGFGPALSMRERVRSLMSAEELTQAQGTLG